MRAEQHMAKAQRLEDSRRTKLDTEKDHELVVWSCIHGGAQLLNVVLHRFGVTDDDFDMIHTWVPDPPTGVPDTLTDFFDTLRRIEALGPRFVRGCEPWSADVGRQCLADYAALKASAENALRG
jgi:hypothetical protein